MLHPAFCPLVGCVSNAWWLGSRVCPPGRFGQYGTGVQARGWLVKHPLGMTMASLTQFFICGASFITTFMIIGPLFGLSVRGLVLAVTYNALLFMAGWSHLAAMTTDPGVVPRNALPLESQVLKLRKNGDSIPRCRRTGTFKPPRSHYDRILKRNVVKMDHHCPWVNNCVGVANQKMFILFCLYISLSCEATVLFLLKLWITCSFHAEDVSPVCVNAKQPLSVFFYILLCFEAFLFGLFTLCMMCDQLGSVYYNRTYIDFLQGKRYSRNNFRENFQEVFGDAAHWLEWLLPVRPRWRNEERIMGFRTDVRKPAFPIPDAGVLRVRTVPVPEARGAGDHGDIEMGSGVVASTDKAD